MAIVVIVLVMTIMVVVVVIVGNSPHEGTIALVVVHHPFSLRARVVSSDCINTVENVLFLNIESM